MLHIAYTRIETPPTRKLVTVVKEAVDIRYTFYEKRVTLLHSVLEVALKNEKWIVDVTGSQSGFREIIVPFDQYMRERVILVDCVEPANYSTWRRLHEAIGPVDNRVPAHQLTEIARSQFSDFIQKHFGTGTTQAAVEDFVSGTTETFQGMLNRFLEELKQYVLEITGLY